MKHTTATLEGALLDAAVLLAHNIAYHVEKEGRVTTREVNSAVVSATGKAFEPSTSWSDGGPIIQREHIELHCQTRSGRFGGEWYARVEGRGFAHGPTPLIAAMRAYVASKLGAEVDL